MKRILDSSTQEEQSLTFHQMQTQDFQTLGDDVHPTISEITTQQPLDTENNSLQTAQKKRKVTRKQAGKIIPNTRSASFGNYNRYYSYRYSHQNSIPNKDSNTVDPRLELIRKALVNHFESRLTKDGDQYQLSCLDIGCNQGLFTLQMADILDSTECHVRVRLKKFTAIDMDPTLIKSAKNHLKEIRKHNTLKVGEEEDKFGMDIQTFVSIEKMSTEEEKQEKLFA